MYIDHSQVKHEAYQNHEVFELIEHMMEYYDVLADTSFFFMPNGTMSIGNYAAHVYMSIRSTLDSIKILLKEGRESQESEGQELSYTPYTPINTIYSLRNRYLSVA